MKSLFIIEDSEVYTLVIKNALKKTISDLDISTFIGKDCIPCLYEKPDIILLDYYLYETTGLDILEEINEISPKSLVIIISGQDDLEIASRLGQQGIYDYITKSEKTDMFRIVNSINNALDVIDSLNKISVKDRIITYLIIGSIGYTLIGLISYLFSVN